MPPPSESIPPFVIPTNRLWLLGNLLACVTFGIHVSVFAQTIYAIAKSPKQSRYLNLLSIFVCVQFALGTAPIVANVVDIAQAYTNLEGPIATLEDIENAKGFTTNFYHSCFIVANTLADSLLVSRLFFVWGRNFYIIIVPLCALFVGVALSVWNVVGDRFEEPSFLADLVELELAYASLTTALNAFVTLAIVYRLAKMRKSVSDSVGAAHAVDYLSIASILIESAALITVDGIIYVALVATSNLGETLITPFLSQNVSIAPELIILRVARGQSWSSEVNREAFSTFQARQATGSMTNPSVGGGDIIDDERPPSVALDLAEGGVTEERKATNGDFDEKHMTDIA